MKQIALFMVALALCLNLKAGENFYSAHPTTILVFTNTPLYTNFTVAGTNILYAGTNTQSTVITLAHGFQMFYTVAGTNTGTFYVDRTIDCTNWINLASFALTVSTNWETNIVGKASQYRFRYSIYSTNGSLLVNYISE